MLTFSRDDTYKVTNIKKDEKLVVDYKVLVRLYQPLIGCKALSLYLTLESEYTLNRHNKEHNKISFLHQVMQFENDDDFNKAIDALKTHNLISFKGNSKKQDDYAFFLIQAKTATEFLNDEKLCEDLKVLMGESYYNQMKNYFTTEDEFADYVDIDEFNNKENKEMDEETFYFSLCEKYPSFTTSTFNDKTRREIARLKNLFHLSYSDMENALINCVDYDDNFCIISLDKLNDFVSQNRNVQEKELSKDDKIVKTFKERSLVYLMRISNRTTLFPMETEAVNYLLDTYKIKEEVLNVVISYYYSVNKSNNLRAINITYFSKVIEDMLLNNVKDAKDAMNYFRKLQANINKKGRTNNSYANKEVSAKEETAKEEVKKENKGVDPEKLRRLKELMGD